MLESDFDKAVKGLLDFKNNPGRTPCEAQPDSHPADAGTGR
jgi:hypothetical protein